MAPGKLKGQTIPVLPGTGRLGKLLVQRLTKAGISVVLGSRDAAKAREAAAFMGFLNEEAAAVGDITFWTSAVSRFDFSPNPTFKTDDVISLSGIEDGHQRVIGGDHPEGELLLVARKFRRFSGTEFFIFSNADDLSRQSSTCVGKLRCNVIDPLCSYSFTVFDTEEPHDGALSDASDSRWWRSAGKNSIRARTRFYNVGHIVYHIDYLRLSRPIRLHYTLHNIPSSAMTSTAAAPTTTEFPTSAFTVEDFAPRWGCIPTSKSKSTVTDLDLMTTELLSKPKPLVL